MYALGLLVGAFVPFLIGGTILYLILKFFKLKNAFLVTIFILLIVAILMLIKLGILLYDSSRGTILQKYIKFSFILGVN